MVNVGECIPYMEHMGKANIPNSPFRQDPITGPGPCYWGICVFFVFSHITGCLTPLHLGGGFKYFLMFTPTWGR